MANPTWAEAYIAATSKVDASDQLASKWSEELRITHGLAASIGDARARYEATHDERYLRSIEMTFPLFQRHIAAMRQIAAQLSGAEMPSQFLRDLSETSDWLKAQGKKVVEGAADTAKDLPSLIKYIAVGAVVLGLAYIAGQIGPITKAVKGFTK